MKHQISTSSTCKINANDAWDELKRFSIPHKYISFLQNTIIIGNQSSGLGATRRVFTKYSYMDETITDWKEGKGFTLKLHKNNHYPYPFSSATFIYLITPINENSCELIGTFQYSIGFGVIGRIINQLFLGIIIRFNIRRVIMGLETYLS